MRDVCHRGPIIQTGASLDGRVAYYLLQLLLHERRRSGDDRGVMRARRRGTDPEQHMVHAQWFSNHYAVHRGQQPYERDSQDRTNY